MLVDKKQESQGLLFKKDKKRLNFSDERVRRALLAGFCIGVISSILIYVLVIH